MLLLAAGGSFQRGLDPQIQHSTQAASGIVGKSAFDRVQIFRDDASHSLVNKLHPNLEF